jgi:hypothetical protein
MLQVFHNEEIRSAGGRKNIGVGLVACIAAPRTRPNGKIAGGEGQDGQVRRLAERIMDQR